ncbi:MAG: hypothetical protein AAF725_04735, partial [Acidobacteriota bacterium]
TFDAAGPAAGIQHGRLYELNHSPEGLDTFVNIALNRAMPRLDDSGRVAILAASGVDRLVLHRPLEGVPTGRASLLAEEPGAAWIHRVYRIENALPEYRLVGTVRGTSSLNEAVGAITSPGFDPRSEAVVRSSDAPEDLEGPPGRVEVVSEGLERIVLDVDSPGGGVLLTRRAYSSLYKASVDGAAAPTAVANVHKLALAVPPGAHRVELWVDRRPTALAASAALLAALGLALWAGRPSGRAAPEPADAPELADVPEEGQEA